MEFDTIRRGEAAQFLPVVKRHPVALREGRGSRVRDVEGREFIDLMAGWGVTCIGHCHPTLVDAISQQAGRLMQTTNIFYTEPQAELCERLVGISPEGITRVFIVNSGTEAVEGAIKLAHRATGRSKYVTTENSFHGRTIGALGVIGQNKQRAPYLPLLNTPTRIPFDDLGAAAKAIDRDTAAIIVEPVQGEGGVNVPSDGYLAGLREICDGNGALLILDEVQTGIARTGRMLALEHDDVLPDIFTLGKGLGGGFPVAAFLCTETVAATVQLGDHGTTFGGNPLACAAANAVLQVIAYEGLVERADHLGAELVLKLEAFAAANPTLVETVRGRGLLVGLVLRDAELAASIPSRALEAGVLVNVTAGRVVRFFPALNIPHKDLWEATDRILELIAS
jgi:acetylornithine/N-succinyldiaminopimelate aminotransferase